MVKDKYVVMIPARRWKQINKIKKYKRNSRTTSYLLVSRCSGELRKSQ